MSETNTIYPHFPDIEVELSKVDGNAYAIMGAVSKALRRGGATQQQIEDYLAESTVGDYDNLLRVAMRWVTVT